MAITTIAGLEASHAVTEMSRGTIETNRAVVLDHRNAGLNLTGAWTTIKNKKTTGSFIDRGALAIHSGWGALQTEPQQALSSVTIPMGRVGWLYSTNGDGSMLYPGPVTRFTEMATIPPSSLAVTMAVKAEPVSILGASLATSGGHPFQVGDDVFLTDGPLINELIPEWRRVISVSQGGLTLDMPPKKAYKQPTLCGGLMPKRMTFQGLTFDGDMGPVFIAHSLDLNFIDCTFAANSYSLANSHNGWLTIVGSARLVFERCKIESGLSISSSHDVTFRDCQIRRLIAEQAAYDCTIEGCEVGWLDSRIQSTGWTLRDSTFYDWLPVYDLWDVRNCVSMGPVCIRGRRAMISGLRCPAEPYYEPNYQGHPPGAATECQVSGVIVG